MKNILKICVLSLFIITTANAKGRVKRPVHDQESCTNNAAQTAKTAAGLQIMIENCKNTYPAIRNGRGGYSFYDTQLDEWIDVSGPVLSQNDLASIYKMKKYKIQQDNEIKKENEIAENMKNNLIINTKPYVTVTKVEIIYENGSPPIDWYKIIKFTVYNGSNRSVRGIQLNYMTSNKELQCGGKYPYYLKRDIIIPPYSNAVIEESVGGVSHSADINGCASIYSIDDVE